MWLLRQNIQHKVIYGRIQHPLHFNVDHFVRAVVVVVVEGGTASQNSVFITVWCTIRASTVLAFRPPVSTVCLPAWSALWKLDGLFFLFKTSERTYRTMCGEHLCKMPLRFFVALHLNARATT